MATYKIKNVEYDYDGELTVGEAILFQEHAHLPLSQINSALLVGNPYATKVFMFVLKKRAGEAIRLQDLDNVLMSDLKFVPPVAESVEDGEDEASAADPTVQSGKTRKGASTSTT